jgi:type II secretory pathway component PulC
VKKKWLSELVNRFKKGSGDPERDSALDADSHLGPQLSMDKSTPPEKGKGGSTSEQENSRNVTRRIDLDQLLHSSNNDETPLPASSSEDGSGKPLKNRTNLFNFDGNELITHIFSPSHRSLTHKTFIVITVVVTALFGGKLLALWLQPKAKHKTALIAPISSSSSGSHRKQNSAAIKKIADANLFRAKRSRQNEGDKKAVAKRVDPRAKQACLQASRKSSLPIKLGSSVVLQDSVKSVVSVQIRGNSKQLRLREGDKIQQLAEIGRITGNRLIVKNISSGKCEYVEKKRTSSSRKKLKIVSADEGKKIAASFKKEGIENVGNNYKIKKTLRDEMLKDIGLILTQARAIQIKNPDGSLSFKMVEIEAGSIYNQLNIIDGDVITAINGKKIDSLNEIMNMFGKISDIENLQITVKRDGSQEVMDYTFE